MYTHAWEIIFAFAVEYPDLFIPSDGSVVAAKGAIMSVRRPFVFVRHCPALFLAVEDREQQITALFP